MILIATLSCSGNSSDSGVGEIGIEIFPISVIAVPGDGKTCTDVNEGGSGSLKEYRLVFQQINLTWDSEDQLYLSEIRLQFKEAGIEYKQSINSTELNYLFNISGGVFGTEKELSSAACGLNFGGISITDETKSFVTTATLEVRGFAVASDKTQYPARGKINVVIQHFQ